MVMKRTSLFLVLLFACGCASSTAKKSEPEVPELASLPKVAPENVSNDPLPLDRFQSNPWFSSGPFTAEFDHGERKTCEPGDGSAKKPTNCVVRGTLWGAPAQVEFRTKKDVGLFSAQIVWETQSAEDAHKLAIVAQDEISRRFGVPMKNMTEIGSDSGARWFADPRGSVMLGRFKYKPTTVTVTFISRKNAPPS